MEKNEIESSLKVKMDDIYKYYSKKLRYRWILALIGLVSAWFLLMCVPKTGFVNPLDPVTVAAVCMVLTIMFFLFFILVVFATKNKLKKNISNIDSLEIKKKLLNLDDGYLILYGITGVLVAIQFVNESMGVMVLVFGTIVIVFLLYCIDWIMLRIVFKNIRYDMGFTESLFSVPIYKIDKRLSKSREDLFKLYIPRSFSKEEAMYVVSQKAKKLYYYRLESYEKQFDVDKELLDNHMFCMSISEQEFREYADVQIMG